MALSPSSGVPLRLPLPHLFFLYFIAFIFIDIFCFIFLLLLKHIINRPKALRLLEPKLVAYVRRAKEMANIDVQIATLVYSFNNWTPIAENDNLKISVYNFQDDSLRLKEKRNKDTDGYLPAF